MKFVVVWIPRSTIVLEVVSMMFGTVSGVVSLFLKLESRPAPVAALIVPFQTSIQDSVLSVDGT